MPTGYTHTVQTGETTEFADFAMQCARAFGACVTMRDDDPAAAIPAKFEPSDYSSKRIVAAQEEVARLEAMTAADRAEAADKANRDAVERWDRYEAEKAVQKARYEAMLDRVDKWVPPTSEHQGLKAFMRSQLTDSIKFDCSPYGSRPKPVSADDWHSAALEKANRDIAYHGKAQAEEIERARERTKWISDLRASLLPTRQG